MFGALGALYVLGSMVPFMGNIAIDRLKESLQIDLATQVVAKIFEMQYDSMVSTPTGEFVQLISKVQPISILSLSFANEVFSGVHESRQAPSGIVWRYCTDHV